DDIGPTVGLASDDRYLRHARLRKRVEQLRAVPDDAVVFLVRAGQETRDVDKCHQRDIERVTEAHEARCLDAGGDIERSGEHGGLVRDDANAVPVETAKSDDDVPRVVRLDLQEI